jgi:hypothetical protein
MDEDCSLNLEFKETVAAGKLENGKKPQFGNPLFSLKSCIESCLGRLNRWHCGSFTISNGNSLERRRRTHGGRDVQKRGGRHHWCPKALHIQGWSNSCSCCLHLLFLPLFSPFQLVIHSRYNTNQNAWFDTSTFNKGVRVTDRWQNEQTTQSSSNPKPKKNSEKTHKQTQRS